MSIILTMREGTSAYRALQQAGIEGADARTCLRAAKAAAPAGSLAEWVESVRGRTAEDLRKQYGSDGVRAVLALRKWWKA